MARPESTIELSDAEKRDLIALIQAGKPFGDDKRISRSLASRPLSVREPD
ncbi:MAG TPA: hypothetical protein VNS61_01560 [Caldimonas sp.]|jgi:hypothetical protein|nr:hypothetical protein [Caldimonas sp.]